MASATPRTRSTIRSASIREIVSTHYMCGEGYRFDPNTMQQVGTAN